MKNFTVLRKSIFKFLLLTFCLTSLNLMAQTESIGVTDLSQVDFIQKVEKQPSTVIIDVRSAEEFSAGHIPNAINISHSDILANPSLLDKYKNQDKVFYCHSGARTKKVTDLLADAKASGVFHLEGDFRAWQGNERTIEK